MEADQSGSGQLGVFTWANGFTLLRLLGAPAFAWLLLGAHDTLAAAVLLGVLGSTDWVDGFLARRLGQVSKVGKVFDPVADRILLLVAVCSAIDWGAVPLWLGVVVLVREVIVSSAVLALAAAGAERIDVLWIGKAGTFALMLSLPLFFGFHAEPGWRDVLVAPAWIAAIAGIALSWGAAGAYLPAARRALRAAHADTGG